MKGVMIVLLLFVVVAFFMYATSLKVEIVPEVSPVEEPKQLTPEEAYEEYYKNVAEAIEKGVKEAYSREGAILDQRLEDYYKQFGANCTICGRFVERPIWFKGFPYCSQHVPRRLYSDE